MLLFQKLFFSNESFFKKNNVFQTKKFHFEYYVQVKNNRQNRNSTKKSGYRKNPSSDWLGKDWWESDICVQSLSYNEFVLSAEGGVRGLDKSDFKSR